MSGQSGAGVSRSVPPVRVSKARRHNALIRRCGGKSLVKTLISSHGGENTVGQFSPVPSALSKHQPCSSAAICAVTVKTRAKVILWMMKLKELPWRRRAAPFSAPRRRPSISAYRVAHSRKCAPMAVARNTENTAAMSAITSRTWTHGRLPGCINRPQKSRRNRDERG